MANLLPWPTCCHYELRQISDQTEHFIPAFIPDTKHSPTSATFTHVTSNAQTLLIIPR